VNGKPLSQAIGRYRWTICTLVFFATTINYLDRAVISLLKNELELTFKWSETDYSNIVVAFQISYAAGMLVMGRVIDRIGTRIGYAIAIFAWSLAAVSHALVKSTFGFIVARVGLGLSEAGNFPAAVKVTAEWFPKKERALATGFFNSGANIGAILAPLTVPLIAEQMGWQWAFILTGLLGFIWLIFWFRFYEIPSRQKRVSSAELDYINVAEEGNEKEEPADPGRPTVTLTRLLSFRQAWAFILGKFLTDPIWWFYLFWLPAFLKAEFGIEKTAAALPVALVFSISSVGSIFGGWLPLYLIRKGWTVFRARKTAMFFYALSALPVLFAQYLGRMNSWYAVLIIGFATAAHAAWSANLYTTVSDLFPRRMVASVIGTGGMAGALGGMLIARLAGSLFDYYKGLGNLQAGYFIMFIICGLGYVLAWILMHVLVPVMKRAQP
jgi:ACS family hexuronate transporter-like MFS transporter